MSSVLRAAPPSGGTTASSPRRTGSGTAVGVRLEGVGRRFGEHVVLEGIDLDVAPGEVVALLGPSGCGKSTLLRAVAGLDAVDDGRVLLDGGPVGDHDARCAIAFQEPRLLPWRSLAGNVALGLPRGTAKAAGRERVAELLEVVGLSRFAGHRPRSVSGGMAQRTALARALARRPGVLVLDEPFAALDALTRLTMQDLLLEVLAATPTTVVLVTHDVEEALHLADRVVVLGRRPGADGAAGAGVVRTTTVAVAHPRDRGDAHLASLRAELLELLGVPPSLIPWDDGADQRRRPPPPCPAALPETTVPSTSPLPTRRSLLGLLALVPVAPLALAGCAAGEDSSGAAPAAGDGGSSAPQPGP